VADRTPALTGREFGRRLGAQVYLKAQSFHRGVGVQVPGRVDKVSSMSPRELARGAVASLSTFTPTTIR
jgi:threonine dehydratase